MALSQLWAELLLKLPGAVTVQYHNRQDSLIVLKVLVRLNGEKISMGTLRICAGGCQLPNRDGVFLLSRLHRFVIDPDAMHPTDCADQYQIKE